jgi:aryl-alcohol dehydrogenase-like predicted oxidoreductase
MSTSLTIFRTALEVGYRFLDCAQFYGNEKEVGMAIQDSKIPRSELFLASKVWCDNIYRGPSAGRLPPANIHVLSRVPFPHSIAFPRERITAAAPEL